MEAIDYPNELQSLDEGRDRSKILEDTDGDTHATVSHLRYSFGNWIWGTVGHSGFNDTVGGENFVMVEVNRDHDDLGFGKGLR